MTTRRQALWTASTSAMSPFLERKEERRLEIRSRLLAAVEADSSEVIDLINQLVDLDPSGGRGAVSDALDGSWELIWAQGVRKFSPLLGLPRPLRPTSQQLLGPPALTQTGEESRAANTLSSGVLGPARLILSSKIEKRDPSTLEIFPPFWLDLEIGQKKQWRLVDADSDATFRATQARSLQEQQAPRNLYTQLYLEDSNLPGDIRISKVVAGDPVIVGATFLHRRLSSS